MALPFMSLAASQPIKHGPSVHIQAAVRRMCVAVGVRVLAHMLCPWTESR